MSLTGKKTASPRKNIFSRFGVLLGVLVILTIYGAEAHGRHQRLATPASTGDQGAYLAYARQMFETNYGVIGDRNRMPVFPFLLSLIYEPGASETQFLNRAQLFNINLSIALLVLLFLIIRKYLPALPALALLCATAFGVFLYRAVNAQCEVLYYIVSFSAFVLLLRMLIAPRWWLALLCGATVGLAHLTKASILPALGIWIGVFVVQILWSFRSAREPVPNRTWRMLAMLALVIATFLAVVFPYIRTSARIYGQLFYNVNSNFVMWCDSSSEGWEFLKKHGTQDEWRGLPPDEVPSPAKYWREHSLRQIAARLINGLRDLIKLKVQAIGYYKFVVLFAFAGCVLWIQNRSRVHASLAEKPFATAFCFLFLLAYILLYAWYGAILKDTRFVLSIFLPYMFVASLFVLKVGSESTLSFAGRRLPVPQFLAGLTICFSLIDAVYNGIVAISE